MKRILAFIISSCLILSSTITNAATIQGWNLKAPVAQRASAFYEATKNAGDIVRKSSVLITPNAAEVSRVLKGGAAGFALSVVVEQLLGAVDWVMDPANNQIVYSEKPVSDEYTNNEGKYTSEYQFSYTASGKKTFTGYDALTVCSMYYSWWNTQQNVWKYEALSMKSSTVCNSKYSRVSNPADYTNTTLPLYRVKNPNKSADDRQKQTLPLDSVAQKVISNAEAGDADAQEATVAAAENMVADAENDADKQMSIIQQLEANATAMAGIAPTPNDISHNRENNILKMKQGDPCDDLKDAIGDLEKTIKWRKSDLNPKEKGSKVYVGHQKRISILRTKKDELERGYKTWCEGT